MTPVLQQQPRAALLRRRHRTAAAVTAAVGVVAALVAWAVVGSRGPGSAALGAVLVLVFFATGTVPFSVMGDGKDGKAGFAFLVLATNYVLRIALGGIVYSVATHSSSVDSKAVGLTVIACALAWVNTQVVLGMSRRHQPFLDA